VGVIPEEWEVKEFASVAVLERGKFTARPRNDPKYYGGDIPFIQTGDVTNSSGAITTYSQTLNAEGLKVSKLFPRETLFFTIAANIGDVGFASFDTACPDSLIAVTPGSRVNKRWLFHELHFPSSDSCRWIIGLRRRWFRASAPNPRPLSRPGKALT
jgi:type I restriction enzyme, S subunit